jgi:hypothetical protein
MTQYGAIPMPSNKGALKPLIANKAWIPAGHANSVGRNKFGAQKKFN